MQVTFFRHGIAVDRADPLAPVDFERPLTLDGKNKTESSARGLRALGLRPALVLSSPYRRCVQSARLVAQVLGVSKKSVRELDALRPGADPRALWPELALVSHESIFCVGHGGALEPIVGVALGLLASTPDAEVAAGDPAPSADAASPDVVSFAFDPAFDAVMRTLHLKKAGALQLDVSFDPVLSARLAWLLAPRILRQLGRG